MNGFRFTIVFLLAQFGLVLTSVPAADTTNIWIIGDSTVRNGQGDMVGWGEVIDPYFDDSKVTVHNHAIGGRSSRTFRYEGRWKTVLDQIETGDVVLVQFGHNDVGAIDARGKFRGSLKDRGNKTEEVERPDGSVEEVHTFWWYMRQYAEEGKAAGATVVLLSPVPHKDWDGNRLKEDFEAYRDWAKSAARVGDAHYVDLTEIVTEVYDDLGPEEVEPLFADARTHTSRAGAEVNARCVIAGLKGIDGDPFAEYFSEQAAAVEPEG